MQRYPYARGPLLDKPNTYFYSQYGGVEFLNAWKEEREGAIHALGKPAFPPNADVVESFEDIVEKVDKEGAIITTYEILEVLYHTLAASRGTRDKKVAMFIDTLVKKFEVSKRWYRSYRARLRVAMENKDDKNAYGDLALYLRAAEIFEAAYLKFNKLPYLNVFLKSLDTLCALRHYLVDEQRGRLVRLLMNEREYVDSLAKLKGVLI